MWEIKEKTSKLLHLHHCQIIIVTFGHGGGQVVSMLAFYSDDPSLNPAEAYSFSETLCLKRMKIKQKRPGLAH